MPSVSNAQAPSRTSGKVREMAYIAVFAVLIAICSWISIPTTVPFTLQTFAVFLAAALLGGRRATLSVVVWLLLGAVGIPVFAQFTSGIGIILGSTGGYMLGFLLTTLLVWLTEKLLGDKLWALAASLAVGMVLCYAFGTAWFMAVYARESGAVGLGTALAWCVLPFLPFDAAKLVLALVLRGRLKKLVRL